MIHEDSIPPQIIALTISNLLYYFFSHLKKPNNIKRASGTINKKNINGCTIIIKAIAPNTNKNPAITLPPLLYYTTFCDLCLMLRNTSRHLPHGFHHTPISDPHFTAITKGIVFFQEIRHRFACNLVDNLHNFGIFLF